MSESEVMFNGKSGEIELMDGTKFRFSGELAERASNVWTDEVGLIYFGDVVITRVENLKSYYCHEEKS